MLVKKCSTAVEDNVALSVCTCVEFSITPFNWFKYLACWSVARLEYVDQLLRDAVAVFLFIELVVVGV